MAKTYVTFGQVHVHRVSNQTFDKDCVAVITHEENESGRDIAFELFGPKFCFAYSEKSWNPKNLKFFPRGYIAAN